MTTKELYTKGARIWIAHTEKVWEGAEVTQDFRGGVLIVRTDDDGTIKQIKIEKDDDLPHLRNPTILIGENDLTSLSYLHEPAVLHNLKVRFCDLNAIYTYCGIVLVAINPYDDLPIYGQETILAYRGQAMGDLDPHIFAVAEEAYTKLERERRDQSIIVSGESGAGKTVSAKYTMRYFATVGGSSTETQVEKKVLASSPIMEAIGNAKTTRNDNSSRFGKFIEIHFDRSFHIIGASMRTYLLEKSRVVFQAPEERNYHIFYQLCSVRNKMPELCLDHQDTFEFLNQGDNPTIEGVDDEKTFMETRQALKILGFSETEQMDMFTIWSAILHLGNVKILDEDVEFSQSDDKDDSSTINLNDKHLKIFCSLLGVNCEDVAHKLTHRKIISRNDIIVKSLGGPEARAARDALAKHIYAELFNWIVLITNKALRCTQPVNHFIGVLDIYGFETFETNSFEQFCINYANEKLQQQFNSHVFKLEQEEYLREEITWTMIHFYDNQPCIDLIEARLGVLDLLDEECRMPQGSDSSWAVKLYSKCGQSSHFVKPRFGSNAFVIKHFADDVEYQALGFLEKNRDTVLEEQVEALRSSKACPLLKLLLSSQPSATLGVPQEGTRVKVSPAKPASNLIGLDEIVYTTDSRFTNLGGARLSVTHGSSKQNRQSVGAQFRGSLTALMTTLNNTTPHYVRCIKPNDDKRAFQYDPARAVQQLRACGVLETIRISAAGFPSRWLYQDFFVRYRVLCNSKDINRNNAKATCGKIIENSIKDEDKYRFGKAKIFFRAGQVAYLEKLRAERLRRCCIIMQSQMRAFVCRKKYLRIRSAVCGIQRYARGHLARRLAQELRRQRAAKTLQKHVRGWLARTKYRRLKATALGIQRYGRGLLARRRFMELKYNAAAITIQRHIRGWLARRRYTKMRRQIVICQSAIRRFLARRLYKKLRAEARSVEHVKKLNVGLENKIISLQQKIETLQTDNKQLVHLHADIADLKLKLEPMKALEAEVKRLKVVVIEKDTSIEKMLTELTVERDNNIELVEQKNRQLELYNKEKREWQYESEKIAKELISLKELNLINQKDSEKKLREQHEIEKRELISELDLEKTAYQRLLTEQYELQTRLEEAQAANKGHSGMQGHHRSLSNASNASQSETADDDNGYGSVKSTHKPGFDIKEWLKGDHSLPDPGLVIRLQKWGRHGEDEKSRLNKQIERLECARIQSLVTADAAASGGTAEDHHRINELEIECTRLSDDLKRLRASVARADGADLSTRELAEQFAAQQEELERRREECIQLRSVLANQRPWFQALKNVTVNLKSLATSNYGSDVDVINEDGELVQAFEAQKRITRQLEEELLLMKEHFKTTMTEYQIEITKIRKEQEDQNRLITTTATAESQKEQLMQFEIARIATENINLQEQNNALTETCERYRKELNLLKKKLKDRGVDNLEEVVNSSTIKEKDSSILPVVRKKEREEYMGMFEYKSSQGSSPSGTIESLIIKRLVIDLSPRTAITLLPTLPSYVLFMCIRYTDHINDEEKVKLLLKFFIHGVKKLIKKKGNDLDSTVLWLANTLRLLHCLKQYSGDGTYQDSNTPTQNEQCLRNFDLSEYRQVLSDIAVWIYQGLISLEERRIQGMIVGALLEYEEISGVSGGVPRGRAQSVGGGATGTTENPRSPKHLVDEFTYLRKTLDYFGVDPELIVQIFKQLYYFVCATCLNQLLLRKDLCRWSKGMQIRYNLSYLEVWLKENCASYNQEEVGGISATLNPIVQAVFLLQTRKSSADVQSTCDMCPDLTPMQICKILNLYTPAEDYEPTITAEFIRQIQTCLQERNKDKQQNDQANLLMDSKFNFAVRFPFNPSKIRLEDIELPEALNLHDLLTKL